MPLGSRGRAARAKCRFWNSVAVLPASLKTPAKKSGRSEMSTWCRAIFLIRRPYLEYDDCRDGDDRAACQFVQRPFSEMTRSADLSSPDHARLVGPEFCPQRLLVDLTEAGHRQ
jgi:hypothetical protein